MKRPKTAMSAESGAKPSPPALSHGIGHLFKALGYSLAGLVCALKSSTAFRQECIVLLVICAALALTGKGAGWWLRCVCAWLAVMAGELLNSALEEAFNRITTEYSPGVKAGKDMASAAVFVLMLANAGVWLYVFGNDILALAAGGAGK